MGCPTVLIGGAPAARMGDLAVCVGPPDSIAIGSPVVLIGGMMAARMGDMTVHGGMIAAGLPTVLIGEGEARINGRAMSGAEALKSVGLKPITLEAKQQGKFCGACHNGKAAFGIDRCDSCHKGNPVAFATPAP